MMSIPSAHWKLDQCITLENEVVEFQAISLKLRHNVDSFRRYLGAASEDQNSAAYSTFAAEFAHLKIIFQLECRVIDGIEDVLQRFERLIDSDQRRIERAVVDAWLAAT